MAMPEHDVLLVGGGLSAGLIALALAARRPDVRVAIVEAGARFGGNHTWSSFVTDLSEAGQQLVAPLIAHRWDGYMVRFPGLERRFAAPYQSATSDRLDAALAALPGLARFIGTPVAELAPDAVMLADGRVLRARAVVDARGQRPSPELRLGFQKFVGLEVELEAPHGLTGPVIMDASVDQHEGYRFVYTLPFSSTAALIEDTYYTDGDALDGQAVAARVRAYAAGRGWRIARVLRTEEGVLPIALGGDIQAHLAALPAGIAPVGLAAALFHPVTGYSFPDAVRLALLAADLPDLSGPALDQAVRAHAIANWRARGFYRMLNRMLFRAARPAERWRVLRHFYALDPRLVARFYAGHSSRRDKARMLMGKPPVPIGRAIRAVMEG